MSNKQILIIEDGKTLLEAIEKKIQKEGYNTLTAIDGKEGLEKIKQNKPDLIILDVLMPKLGGFGVLEAMKKDSGIPNIPVIIISNSGQPVEIEKAIALGARDYLIKAEFDPEEVVAKMKKILKIADEEKINKNSTNKKETYKILIIEDDQLLLGLCSAKLQKDGFEIEMAVDAKEGLEKSINGKPNLILLDLILPGMHGLEILKKIKTNPDENVSKIPVIILSNLGQESDIEEGKKLGAEDYLIKASVTVDEIADKIKKVLNIDN